MPADRQQKGTKFYSFSAGGYSFRGPWTDEFVFFIKIHEFKPELRAGGASHTETAQPHRPRCRLVTPDTKPIGNLPAPCDAGMTHVSAARGPGRAPVTMMKMNENAGPDLPALELRLAE
jgi:hypothetical protein